MNKIENFKSKLQIDEHGLEIALREHPELVYDVGIELARAVSLRDHAKQDLDETSARAALDVRKEAADNDEKITEKTVEAQVTLDADVLKANDEFLKSKYEAAKWQVLQESFEQRSYALSKLCDLYLANYYSHIEKKGTGDYKAVRAENIKQELAKRRNQL